MHDVCVRVRRSRGDVLANEDEHARRGRRARHDGRMRAAVRHVRRVQERGAVAFARRALSVAHGERMQQRMHELCLVAAGRALADVRVDHARAREEEHEHQQQHADSRT